MAHGDLDALRGLSVGVISLGCVKNRVDTEQMLGLLRGAGMIITGEPAQADVLIVNTCGFIEPAKQESIESILEMAAYKQSGRCRVLAVTGCLSQRYPEAIFDDMPEVDVVMGVDGYARLPAALAGALTGRRARDTARGASILECGRVLTTKPYSAYLRIADGCDNRCAYCAIPLIRGAYRARPFDAIADEARALAQGGVRELTVVAQDTTRYRDGEKTLADLMGTLADTPGVDMLRVLYLYPDETDERLLSVMESRGNICRYLDLPLQHASARLLKSMNRRGDPDHVKALLRSARARGFCLRTTFIVGYPGETDADFDELMAFAAEMQFDRMGAFAYSAEDDTPASLLPGAVPPDVQQARLDALMRAQSRISRARGKTRVGTVCRVLCTGHDGTRYIGRSDWEAPDADGQILFASGAPVREGDIVRVRLQRALEYDMTGVAEP